MKDCLKFLIFLLVIISSCAPDTGSDTSDGDTPDQFKTWVFRSVLDGNPRMITLALSDDIWASYHTDRGALYKIWGGTVAYEGAVYNHAHGPQPYSIGNAYFINEYDNPWRLLNSGGDTISLRVDYKGHKFNDGVVSLMYEMSAEGVDPFTLEESVNASSTDGGQPIFERAFSVAGAPDNSQVLFSTNAYSIAVKENIKTNGDLIFTKASEVDLGQNKTATELEGVLTLNPSESTHLDITLLYTPLIDNPNQPKEEEESGNEIHPGLKLIAKADCKTCHNKKLKTIGPSYTAIAEKYTANDENIAMLVNKVKMGGTGVWGKQVMTPHPEVSNEDLQQMIRYIFSLKTNADAQAAEEEKEIPVIQGISGEGMTLLPGLITKAYQLDSHIANMPDVSAMKPKFGGIINNLDNVSNSDFKELEDNFALTCEGYLFIEKPGVYNIRSWSDDGSIVYMNDEKIIDNDGSHSITMKEYKANLSEGYYKVRIEYFNGAGGKFLSFNWKKPGDKYHEVIPGFNLFHAKEQEEDMARLYLPMSNVSMVPGDKEPVAGVHPSFDLFQARPDDFQKKIGGMDFMSDGALIVSVWDSSGSVYRLENVQQGDPTQIKIIKIAQGLAEPLGLAIIDDQIYVMQKQEMTHLVDVDNDYIIDEYRTLSTDWRVSANFHEFGFGLAKKNGKLYAALATGIQPGGASVVDQVQDRGKVIEVDSKTGETRFLASGLRTPNGLGVGYNDDIYVSDNQGDWLPSSKILHVSEGAWFGSRSVDFEGTKDAVEKPPVVWLPQDEIGNSPSTPLSIELGPYKGQMIHGEVTHGGVKRVYVEEVNGQYQGVVFRFIQGLESGVNRMVWGPDSVLYVGGIGNPGNWQHTGTKWYGLQGLRYNGQSTFEMLAVKARTNGVEIEFTEPLKSGDGWNPESYEVKQWYYKPTEEYGGPKLDERKLKVKSASVSTDRKSVFLELEGMKAGHVVYVRLADAFISTEGHSLWSREAWYTMNQIPQDKMGEVLEAPELANNALTEEEKAEGWELLFDGKSIEHFRNYKKETVGSSWVIEDEAIHLNAIQKDGGWQAEDGGDIMTKEIYEDFEFKIDWKIANCGNSGIIFNIVESDAYDYVWQTGPEMQVLDNVCHPDTRYVTHRAGDLYDMIACEYVTVKPAGEWNQAMIRSKDGQADFYLNGYKVVSFTMGTEAWKEMIANSKFKDMKGFGMSDKGHIALQDHGDKVWYRNIKIRKI